MKGYTAIRETVGLYHDAGLVGLRFEGADAERWLEAVCPAELNLQRGQIKHTVLLRDDGRILADAYAARLGARRFLYARGLDAAALLEWLEGHRPDGCGAQVHDEGPDHATLSIHGPFAWELASEVVGPDILGVPYLGVGELGGVRCLRIGETGEYGYTFVVPRSMQPDFEARLAAHGPTFDLAPVDRAALAQCALENGFLDVLRPGVAAHTPLELQQQWRLSRHKPWPGADALKARREAGLAVRSTTLLLDGEVKAGAAVQLDGRPVGEVLYGGRSPLRERWVALALIARPLAHPGIDFAVDGRPARSVSPPVIDNRSIYVDPYRHSYPKGDVPEMPG